MMNKSRGDIAYNIIDLDKSVGSEVIDKLLNIEGVIRVRLLPPINN